MHNGGMIVDGKAIAQDILKETRHAVGLLPRSPSFLALAVAPSPATESYLKMKRRLAEEAGITMEVRTYPDAATDDLIAIIRAAAEDAIIVQLPLPPHIDTRAVLDAIPPEKDADALAAATREADPSIHPVAAAIREIIERHQLSLAGKKAVVVGDGWLVGAPAAAWLRSVGVPVTVVTREEGDLVAALKGADIVITGAGVAGLVRADAIKEGAAVIDVGTSELGGSIAGDVEPEAAERAGLFTPVPGGVGPITVALLLKNVAELSKRTQLRNGR